jgi:hypothetical protein
MILLTNILCRLKQALKAGFRHLIFEDNYDTGTGDHYSLRQICDQSYIRGSMFFFLSYCRIEMVQNKMYKVPVQKFCAHDQITSTCVILGFINL